MRDLIARGQVLVEDFIARGVNTWQNEGRLEKSRADALLASLNTPDVAQAMIHAGVHFAISLPLRFPLGAAARFLYTFFLRARAEVAGVLRRRRPVAARSMHTIPVMLFGLLPGFGRLAYFFSPALMRERLLLVIPMDQVSRKLPFEAYKRLHMEALYVYWADDQPEPGETGRLSPRRIIPGLKAGLKEVSPHLPLLAALLAVDAVALGIGTYIYFASGQESEWWFDERRVVATLDAFQLLAGGIAGIAAYRLFWRFSDRASHHDAFGIFLWGIGGIGLMVFAIEDYFTVHERLGDLLFGLVPGLNEPNDVLVLGYAVVGVAVLYVFHTELVARRASSIFLVLGAISAIVMVISDAFARDLALQAVEVPAQTLAATLLMVAFITRYREVRALAQAAKEPQSEYQLAAVDG